MAVDKERQPNLTTKATESGADAGTNLEAEPSGLSAESRPEVWRTAPTVTLDPAILDQAELDEADLDEEWDSAVDPDAQALTPHPRRAMVHLPRFRGFQYFLTLEVALYGLLIGLAFFTRFYELSYRALHHDEGVHAYYSWKFYDGQGYNQEPWKHGPFLYHVQALVFWLFGDSDQTARVSTALFGVLIIPLPALLRKELGRWGALTASFLLLVSPMFLYFSRFLREDIFTAVATLLLFIGLVRLVDRPCARWWYISMLALALLFCTKEVSFFYLALFGGFLGVWLSWQLAPRLLLILGGYTILALAIFFFVMVLYPPPPIPFEALNGEAIRQYIGLLLVHPVFWAFIILLVVGIIVTWAAFREVAIQRLRFMQSRGWAEERTGLGSALFAPYREEGTVAYAVAWLGLHWKTTLIGLGLAFAFYFVFFTGFFSDIPQGSLGLVTGLWYWMAQQGVARGSQPWYYYFFMLPLYEPLALAFGTLGGGFILIKAFRYSFRRQYRTVLMPVSEYEALQTKNKLSLSAPLPEANEDEDDFDDELDEPGGSGQKEPANRQQSVGLTQSSVLSPQPSLPDPHQLIEVEVALRPAGNALWPGRKRRERHPYFGLLLLVTWAFGSVALYTWASEKMPWLTVQLALPFILLAAYLMDGVWSGIEEYFRSPQPREELLWRLRGSTFFWLYLGGAAGSALLFYMIMLNLSASELKVTFTFAGRLDWLLVWIPPIIVLLLFTAFFSFIGFKLALKTTLAVAFGLLTIYLLHTGFTYAFDHGDVALEMGVYTQTTPDLYRVVKELDTVTTVLPEVKNTPVLYDDDLRTPLDFYLRHYDYKKRVSDFKTLSKDNGSALGLTDFPIILISDSKAATLDDSQKKILADNFIRRNYTFHYWFEEGQYRDFDRAAGDQIAYLQGKSSKVAVKDATNKLVLNKDEIMTTEKLQQLAALPGVLDKVYNLNGGNSSLLHLQWAGKSLFQLSRPADFARLWRYVIYREQPRPLGRREFSLYIKKDLAPLWRQYADLVDFPISRPQ